MTRSCKSNKPHAPHGSFVPCQPKCKLVEQLKSRGIRVTPQRAIILDAIEHMAGHFTAEDVFAAVQKVSSYINLATVYRTLDLLKELDVVSDADMGTGATHFALRTHGPHHHAICRVCGRSFEFQPRVVGSAHRPPPRRV